MKKKSHSVKHLWKVVVRHKDDSSAFYNSMTSTELWIISPQKVGEEPDIDLALKRARAFVKRRRQYKSAVVKEIKQHGFVDN